MEQTTLTENQSKAKTEIKENIPTVQWDLDTAGVTQTKITDRKTFDNNLNFEIW